MPSISEKMPMTPGESAEAPDSPVTNFLYSQDPDNAKLRTLVAGLLAWKTSGSAVGGLLGAAAWAYIKKEPLGIKLPT